MRRSLVASFLGLCPLVAHAVPGALQHQGRLLDADGAPRQGLADLTFTLHADPTTSTALWTEAHDDVALQDGYFSVSLGETTPLSAAVLDGSTRWLAVRVGTAAELGPRTALASVPYALRAGSAEDAGTRVAALADAPVIAVDGAAGNVFDLTLAAARTLGNPTALRDGQLYTFRVRQDGTGGRTLAFGGDYVFEGGVAPAIAVGPGDLTILTFAAVGSKLHFLYRHRDMRCVAGSQVFDYTGAAQSFTMPVGCATLTVKAWGGGGASGQDSDDPGGGGGYTTATLPVTLGDTLSVIVGGGGVCSTSGIATGPFGGGGASGGEYTGTGAGRSAVRSGAGEELVTAGGGGGGGRTSGSRFGGGGGGLVGGTGANGDGPGGGGGGTQTAGGTGGAGANGGAAGGNGSAFQGGAGAITGSAYDGGGGGGGYFGGGGGGSSAHGSCCSGAAGGGGSGFRHPSATAWDLVAATGATPGNAADPERGTAGQGASSGACQNGNPGRVRLTWGP